MTTQGVDQMISVRAVEMMVCGLTSSKHKRATTRVKNGRKLAVIHKLDEAQVRWIVRTNRNGTTENKDIARIMGISVRWVQKLCKKYKNIAISEIRYPASMGRPGMGLPGRREHAQVLSNYNTKRRSAVRLEKIIKKHTGIHITHRTVYRILKDEELVETQPAKAKQRKWVRYERRYSNSMWHTDYKQLPDGRWFVSYMDDASRFLVGFGVFDAATSENAIAVLRQAIKKYGTPAQILTDHGSQFYANEKAESKRGVSGFETELVNLGIKQVMARIRHPQTNGKIERFHSEIKQHLKSFEFESASNTVRGAQANGHVGNPFHTAGMMDPVSRLVEWYNNLEHMSLKDELETPAEAYIRKQPPKDITTEEMEVDVHAKP